MKVTKVDVTVTGLIDGMAVQLSVNEVEGLTQEQAAAINSARAEADHVEELQVDYDRHHRDKVVEGIRYAIQRGQAEDNTDPLDKVADPRADIFSIILPQKQEESKKVVAVKKILVELPEQQRMLFEKRYVMRMTFDEIADEEALATGKRVTKQAVSQRNQRMLARIKKKLEQKFPNLF